VQKPSRTFWRSRWWMPSFSLFLGALVFAALAIGGNIQGAAYGFAVMAVLAGVFWFGGRSETLAGLGGPGRDERWAAIDLRASAFTGLVIITVLIAAWLWQVAHGRDGSPYGQLCAVGGLAYILAVAVLRRRA
jgi:hypothetical protein